MDKETIKKLLEVNEEQFQKLAARLDQDVKDINERVEKLLSNSNETGIGHTGGASERSDDIDINKAFDEMFSDTHHNYIDTGLGRNLKTSFSSRHKMFEETEKKKKQMYDDAEKLRKNRERKAAETYAKVKEQVFFEWKESTPASFNAVVITKSENKEWFSKVKGGYFDGETVHHKSREVAQTKHYFVVVDVFFSSIKYWFLYLFSSKEEKK